MLLVISFLSGLIYLGINQDARSNEVQSTASDNSSQSNETQQEFAPDSPRLSFNVNPNYEYKTEFEEWIHNDFTKFLSVLIIFAGSTFLTQLSMKNEIIRLALFSGAYFGTTIAIINNMIFVATSDKWCLQFLIEYQLLGLFIGLLAGGNAFFMIKYRRQILTPVFRTFAYMFGLFF